MAAALMLLYAPTIRMLAFGLWLEPEHAYSPFILAVAITLLWRRLLQPVEVGAVSSRWPSVLALVAGLLLYLAGRLLGNISIEAGSALLVVPGAIGAVWGWRQLWLLRYPLAMLLFTVPLPGSVVVALTFPMKMAVSTAAATLLHVLGLPIAQQGVVLELGDYRLLVADACSGLQSMFSLSAAALFFLELAGHRSVTRSAFLLVMIVPVAFAANVVRVLLLALITYFLGDAAGQGYLHWVAGMMMFVFAFAALMAIDFLPGPAHRPARARA